MLTLISTIFTIVFYQINSEVREIIIGNNIRLSYIRQGRIQAFFNNRYPKLLIGRIKLHKKKESKNIYIFFYLRIFFGFCTAKYFTFGSSCKCVNNLQHCRKFMQIRCQKGALTKMHKLGYS